jgi:hypothetical protein
MNAELATIEFCREIAGLSPHELLLGVAPGRRHERLLAKYRGCRRSPAMARAKLVADLRAALARGAAGEAADLLVALRRLLAMREVAANAGEPRCTRRRIAGGRARLAQAPQAMSPAARPTGEGIVIAFQKL